MIRYDLIDSTIVQKKLGLDGEGNTLVSIVALMADILLQ